MPGINEATWAQRLRRGDVLDEQGHVLPVDAPYAPGTRVYYYRELAGETPIPFTETVLFQDDHLVVADKPHFLPVAPVGRFVQETLLVRLKQRLHLPDLVPLHRIDRETAGLVLFAVQPGERGRYHALFSQRRMEKTYQAIAPFAEHLVQPLSHHSHLAEHPTDFFRMAERANAAANSETHIEMLERLGGWARYRLRPASGKRHQLRVHMNALGAPLAGDQLYPHVRQAPGDADDFDHPLQLLAQALAFTDPITGQARVFSSGLRLDWPSRDAVLGVGA